MASSRPDPARELARVIDHTLLAASATPAQVERLCDEALEHRFATVCVNGGHVARCARRLSGSEIGVSAVVGFPLGAAAPAAKQAEARIAMGDGASELDMVLAIGLLLGGDLDSVRDDLEGVIGTARDQRVPVKVILETGLLSPDQVVVAARLAVEAGARFVKTSSGFGPRGASVEDVRRLREVVGAGPGVKAAGGIRTRAFALELLAAGATRLGCSASVTLLEEGRV